MLLLINIKLYEKIIIKVTSTREWFGSDAEQRRCLHKHARVDSGLAMVHHVDQQNRVSKLCKRKPS